MPFNKVWTILNLSTESESTIRGWLYSAQLPSSFTFVFDSPFNDMWTTIEAYGGIVPVPYAPWTIIVSSDDDPRFNWTVYGLSWLGNKNCSIMFQPSNPYDTPSERGARIWHEMTHSMMQNVIADTMKTYEFAEFSQYLINTGSQYQDFIYDPSKYDSQEVPGHTDLLIAFYTYLMLKYYPCECYDLQCDGEEEEDDYTDRTKQILISAAIGLGVIALLS
jgi:hypothetical protein